MALVVDTRRRAGGHDGAGVDEGVDDLLRPGLLGVGAHVEHLDALLLELADGAADELGPEQGELRVVDGHHRLLPGAGMTNMFGKPRLIIPNRLEAPSAHFSARVTPPRPTISWPTRR